ncbi:hypothetical protein PTSG_03176 [Salpingoeca rosetta]|uniref:Uncharacterized protein n=1 Tax=Salpingoeca rosetta (strain ATCC 50818 / BSB-021) TaxID=946362 RepID=F2U4G0_SALR5|nr:uncharacterized protein PTSG_03176 [Salpingoeca rosetta]EGD82526.1 hypothetical protein PTSG_03176 [Salpingoeca rosetta]|eukprot:XP_004995762.1 hypothetical protein PTSG_03176 [Salpingoeca rosetta]
MSEGVMRVSEIITDLNQLNINITAKDFKRMDPALVQLVYTSLLEKVLDLDLNEFTTQFQLPPDIDAGFDYPELHDQSVPLAVVNWVMCSLMSDIGVEDFSLADLLHPAEKRTKRNLSVLIPYCYFVLQQRDEQQKVMQELTDIKQESKALQDEIDGIKLAIEDAKKTKQEQEEEERAVEGELDEVKQKAVGLFEEREKLCQTLEQKKQVYTQLRMDIEKMQQAIKEEQETCSSLEARIIKSPERLLKERDEKQQDLSYEQSLLDKYERQYQEGTSKLTTLGDCEESVHHIMKLLQDAHTKARGIKGEKHKAQELQGAIMTAEDELRSLVTSEQGLHDHHKSLQNRLRTLKKKREMTRQSDVQSLHSVHQEREHYAQLRQQVNEEVAHAEQECMTWEEKAERLQRQHQEDVAAARKELDALGKELSSYQGALRACLAH